MAPAKVRTPWKKKVDTKAATKAAGRFKETQKLTPGAMSLASAQKILQGSLGGVKTIVPGAVQILANQKACSRKFDEVCIAAGAKNENGDDWQYGDCDKDDEAAGVRTQGFAWEGVVYVNGETTLVTATAHEILHNNADPNFRGRVGESLNEGVTETLARQAIKDAGITVPHITAYKNEVKLTKLLVDFVGMDVVKKAYLKDAKLLTKAYEKKSGASWGDVVTAANKLDAEALKKALKTKK